MKFVALALAILLAAGCQADAQSKYEFIRAAVVTYLTQAKESAQKAVANLDDDEFKEFKVRFNKDLENVEIWLKSASEYLAPVCKEIGPQIVEFIVSGSVMISNDLAEMREELKPKWVEQREVVKKHLKEYRTLMEPALKEYTEQNSKVVEEFKTKFEPVVRQVQEKLKVNLEETKYKLTPVVEVIRKHLTHILEDLKTTYGPHVQEYREQIESVVTYMHTKYESGVLHKKVKTLIEELRPKLKDIYETIDKAFKA